MPIDGEDRPVGEESPNDEDGMLVLDRAGTLIDGDGTPMGGTRLVVPMTSGAFSAVLFVIGFWPMALPSGSTGTTSGVMPDGSGCEAIADVVPWSKVPAAFSVDS